MFKIRKRASMSLAKQSIILAGSILAALITASIFILAIGHNPLSVFSAMLEGAFGTKYRITETIIKTIPLVITSLGISIAFKMKFWNIGAEGQIMMGGFMATFVALNFSNLPAFILLPLMAFAGMIGGAFWGLIPAFFRAYFKTNETIFTLMMNYIALKWVTYLQYGPWKDPNALGFPKIPNFAESAVLPKVAGIHIGWIIALLLIVFMYIFNTKSKRGFEIAIIGESENTARYAGINVKHVIMLTLMMSGALCGLSGMIEAAGVSKTLTVHLSAGVGYTAIITAWLSQLNSFAILFVSFLFAALVKSGAYIQMAFDIPQAAAQILQGLILFFVLGSHFFVNYQLVWNKKGK
jgi:simple sugar transport system permease protein